MLRWRTQRQTVAAGGTTPSDCPTVEEIKTAMLEALAEYNVCVADTTPPAGGTTIVGKTLTSTTSGAILSLSISTNGNVVQFNSDGSRIMYRGEASGGNNSVGSVALNNGNYDVPGGVNSGTEHVFNASAHPEFTYYSLDSMAIAPDLSTMVLVNNADNWLRDYAISGGNVSTTSPGSYLLGKSVSNTTAIDFNHDGSKLFILGTIGGNKSIEVHTLNTAYSVASTTNEGNIAVGSITGVPLGLLDAAKSITINEDSSRAFLISQQGSAYNIVELSIDNTAAMPVFSYVGHVDMATITNLPTPASANDIAIIPGQEKFVVILSNMAAFTVTMTV